MAYAINNRARSAVTRVSPVRHHGGQSENNNGSHHGHRCVANGWLLCTGGGAVGVARGVGAGWLFWKNAWGAVAMSVLLNTVNTDRGSCAHPRSLQNYVAGSVT